MYIIEKTRYRQKQAVDEMDNNIINIIAGIATVIGVIIAILNYVGYPDIFSLFDKKDVENFDPLIEVKYPDIVFTPIGYDYNYETNLVMDVETWTPHLSKVNIQFIDYKIDESLEDYLDYEVMAKAPYASVSDIKILMENQSYSVDQKHSLNSIVIPLEINNLWVKPMYTVYPTSFKLGTIIIQIELIDIQNKDSIAQDYTIPAFWIKK